MKFLVSNLITLIFLGLLACCWWEVFTNLPNVFQLLEDTLLP